MVVLLGVGVFLGSGVLVLGHYLEVVSLSILLARMFVVMFSISTALLALHWAKVLADAYQQYSYRRWLELSD